MGCSPSKQDDQVPRQAPRAAAGGQAPAHRKLNQQLSQKARHPSAIPGSFAEREHTFRREQQHRKAVPERRQGPCRMRVGGWGSWMEGWCELAAHQLRFFAASEGGTQAPPAGATPYCSLELVGAHLRLERRQELVLTPADDGAAATIALPDERQAQEWMVGLAAVPGLFRRVADYYELGAAWGRGATCVVQECVARYSGQRYALKSRLHKSRGATEAMHNELRILQICAKQPHPAIPALHDYFFDQDGSIELVMDLMEGGELFDHIAAAAQLREADARAIFGQVAAGVAHLHSLGIAHRDLKPQNLMYVSADEGSQVKIMDYDLAKVNYAPTWDAATPCGTIYYMAPEIVQQQRYSLAVDVWSLGVILFILLTGHMPFDGKDREAIAEAIEAGRYRMDPQLWGSVSAAAKDLVRAMLQHDPQLRPTAEQVLQHAWLTSDMDPAASAELASPVQLRQTLSKTGRGRELLAIAALAYSEGDAPRPRSGPTPGLPRLRRLSAGRGPLHAAGEALDFDMQAVRQQAGGGGGARPGSSGAAAGLGDVPEQREQQEEEEALSRLRAQLHLVGTAAGLQDHAALRARGQEPLGGSPRAGAAGGPPSESVPPQQQERRRWDQQQPWQDGFDDLGAQEVEEQDLSGSEAEARPSRPGSGRGSRAAAAASFRRGRADLAPLLLRLPPGDSLPPDEQLLAALEHGSGLQGGPAAGPGARRGSLPRPHSLYPQISATALGATASMQRSTSWLDRSDTRLPAAGREPVYLAMRRKQRRLERMRTAPTLGHDWCQAGADVA